MPSHLLANADQPLPKPKAIKKKTIRKETKVKIQPCLHNLSDCDLSDQNTMAENLILNKNNIRYRAIKQIAHMLRIAIIRFKYSIDTYYVCLLLLSKIKFQIMQKKSRLISAVIFLMAAKVHEYRVPKFVELINWGEFEFKSSELINMEGQLLAYFNFKIPTVLNLTNNKQIENQIKKLQNSFQQIITTFQ